MAVCGLLNIGQAIDCTNKSTGGIEQTRIWLGNVADIDRSLTTVDESGVSISGFNLVAGARLFAFEGIGGKKILNATYSKQEGDYFDTMQHQVDVVVYDQCVESLGLLNNFLNGASVFGIIEQKFKGDANKCAFQIYGFNNGLTASEINYNANENNGIVLLPLSSPEPYEPSVPYSYLNTDYATTLAEIDALV